ncbi:MAG: HAMP domain-containing protein, partial [Terriglobales bacterium]
KKPRASETFFTASGELYQTYFTPVFDDKQKQHVFAILSGGVFPHLQKIDYIIKGLKLGEDNFILITDSRGHFISSDGISEQDAIHYLKNQTAQSAKKFFEPLPANVVISQSDQLPLINERIAVGKRKFIALSQAIPELKLIVTLGINTHRIDQNTRELSNRLLFSLILGLLFSVFASVFLGERLAKPFRLMAQTVEDINTGNFASRVDYKSDDEIGYLSDRINKLADKIQKSEYLGNLWSNEAELEEEPGALRTGDVAEPDAPLDSSPSPAGRRTRGGQPEGRLGGKPEDQPSESETPESPKADEQ